MYDKKKSLAIISALALMMTLGTISASADTTAESPSAETTQTTESTDEPEKETAEQQRERVLESIRQTEGNFRVYAYTGWDKKQQVTWKVYRIGTRIPTDDEFIPEGPFEGYEKVTITKDSTSEDIMGLASGYKALIDNTGIRPDYTFTCDSTGQTEGKIPYGLYLFVMSVNGKDKGEPILVEITDWNEIVDIHPKFHSSTATGGGSGGSGGGGGNNGGGGSNGGGNSGGGGSNDNGGGSEGGNGNNDANPHTAGVLKTATGTVLLIAAAGVGSMIGRKRKDDD